MSLQHQNKARSDCRSKSEISVTMIGVDVCEKIDERYIMVGVETWGGRPRVQGDSHVVHVFPSSAI